MKEKAIGITAAIAAVFIFGVLIWGCLHTHPVTVRVIGKKWDRHIDIETLKTFRETSTSVPSGGRLIREWTDHYTRHHSSTSYSGSGKNRRSHTKRWTTHHTRQMYDYDIDRWTYTYTLDTVGGANTPHWPNVAVIKSGTAVGCERPATHKENYSIDVGPSEFSEEKYSTTKVVTLPEWEKMPIGCIVIVQVNEFGSTLQILPLEE